MLVATHDEFLALYKPVHERFVRYCSSHAYGIMETQDLVGHPVKNHATFREFKRQRKVVAIYDQYCE